MNFQQINAIGLEISKLSKEKEELEKKASIMKQHIVIIDRNLNALQEGVQEARAKI